MIFYGFVLNFYFLTSPKLLLDVPALATDVSPVEHGYHGNLLPGNKHQKRRKWPQVVPGRIEHQE